jgi:hypothetical protein
LDPIFTIQWPEFLLANRLQRLLPRSEGFSVFVPVSRQEKGIDLAIIRKQPQLATKVATIQVKASRTYSPSPPKRKSTKRFRFYTWFNRFLVPDEADFFLLIGMYAPDAARTTRAGADWYKDCTLLFTSKEMKRFMSSCLTVKRKEDKMYGFGFDDEQKAVQTRGDRNRGSIDFTDRLLANRIGLLREMLGT